MPRAARRGGVAYLGGGNSPDLEVIGAHEDLRQAQPEVPDISQSPWAYRKALGRGHRAPRR